MSSVPAFLTDAINSDASARAMGEYGAITLLARQLRDAQLLRADRESELEELGRRIQELQHKALPDAMLAAGVDTLGLPAEGNAPGYEIQLKPFCHANIAASWGDNKREEAFRYLEDQKAGDLLSVEVVVKFGRGQEENAKALAQKLTEWGWSPRTRPSVPWATLTAWVREQVIDKGRTLDLEKIGATVGSIVKLVQRKD